MRMILETNETIVQKQKQKTKTKNKNKNKNKIIGV